MIALVSVIALGFVLGMRHATDPDHVIAVSTIVARHRSIRDAAIIGALWGVGHTLTIFIVGGGILLFGWVIPTRVGLSMECSVGFMLILLGILNLTGILQWVTDLSSSAGERPGAGHYHFHSYGNRIYAHSHGASPEANSKTPLSWLDRHFGRIGLYQVVRPLVVGLVHGLAGSAAVALLVLATIRDPKWAVAYLLVFGFGTIGGMMLLTGAMVVPFAYAGRRSAILNRGLRTASGLISVGFGLFLVYEIGFVNGLFTRHPQWIPR